VAADRRKYRPLAIDLGIGILILSLVHVPLPQADYHNIRHHDAPGEICGYHDHLLRWHPSANRNADVTMLHWHWFVPIVEFGGDHNLPDDEHDRSNPGPAVHAQLGDWPAPDWHGEPVIHPDSQGRLLDHLTLGQSDASHATLLDSASLLDLRSGHLPSSSDNFAGALRAQRGALLQRWNC
jgi:hypothetical protein